MKIKAIIFDLVGVLLVRNQTYIPNNFVDYIDSKIGSVTDDLSFKKAILARTGKTKEEFNLAIRGLVEKYIPEPILFEYTKKLAAKYKLAIINNGTYYTIPHWFERFDFKHFDIFVSSAKVGMIKPDPKIYKLTLDRLGGLDPKECIFCDDYRPNVASANKLGINSIWWKKEKPVEQLINRLETILTFSENRPISKEKTE